MTFLPPSLPPTPLALQPENLLVDPRSGTVKLSSFGRAGMWDPAVGDASDLSYAPCGVPLKHAAPEVSAVTFGERATPHSSICCTAYHRVLNVRPPPSLGPRWCVAGHLRVNAFGCSRLRETIGWIALCPVLYALLSLVSFWMEMKQ